MFSVPKAFLEIARRVVCNADPERFSLLYAALTQLRARPKLFDDAADPLVRRLYDLDKSVRRDVHKMRAFVRFREVGSADGVREVGSADGIARSPPTKGSASSPGSSPSTTSSG